MHPENWARYPCTAKSSLGAWEDSSQSQALLGFSRSRTSVKESAVGTSKNSNLKQTFPSLSSLPPEKERKLSDFLRCRLGLDPVSWVPGTGKEEQQSPVAERSTTGLSLWVVQHSRLEFQGTSPNPPEHYLLQERQRMGDPGILRFPISLEQREGRGSLMGAGQTGITRASKHRKYRNSTQKPNG